MVGKGASAAEDAFFVLEFVAHLTLLFHPHVRDLALVDLSCFRQSTCAQVMPRYVRRCRMQLLQSVSIGAIRTAPATCSGKVFAKSEWPEVPLEARVVLPLAPRLVAVAHLGLRLCGVLLPKLLVKLGLLHVLCLLRLSGCLHHGVLRDSRGLLHGLHGLHHHRLLLCFHPLCQHCLLLCFHTLGHKRLLLRIHTLAQESLGRRTHALSHERLQLLRIHAATGSTDGQLLL
mmetsp:Transcript_32634/g.82540  ORF Transcript_32634/g.82540 Transcript_32634/m.82540 type:complete len:231 (-) Transcript_32634:123-815(-)